jgi:3-oxoacyl-[acyl-carrier protein] reductase
VNLGLAGRTALVLASTSGLGRAVAEALAGEGAAVAVCGRRSELAVEVAAALPGARGFFVDLAQADSVDRLVSDVVSALGPIDILVLNSGGPPASSAADTSPDDLRSSNELLLYPMQQLIRLVLPSMQAAGWGRILAIGSSGVREPIPDLALSNSSRAALRGLLKTLASEVAGDGVTVNMILPGRIATDRLQFLNERRAEREGRSVEEVDKALKATIPVGRYGRPEEFGVVAAFLCSDAASYVTGVQLSVDGGLARSL